MKRNLLKVCRQIRVGGKFFLAIYFGRNYFRFSGRASRKEFWGTSILMCVFAFLVKWFMIFVVFVIWRSGASAETIDSLGNMAIILVNLVPIYCLIPDLALLSRRFHDINMRAWWGLLVIPLFFLPFFKVNRKDNKFGKNIYGEE